MNRTASRGGFVTSPPAWRSSPTTSTRREVTRPMPKAPTPEHPTPDELIAESRRMQELLLSAAADVDAWTSVLRAALAAEDDEDILDA